MGAPAARGELSGAAAACGLAVLALGAWQTGWGLTALAGRRGPRRWPAGVHALAAAGWLGAVVAGAPWSVTSTTAASLAAVLSAVAGVLALRAARAPVGAPSVRPGAQLAALGLGALAVAALATPALAATEAGEGARPHFHPAPPAVAPAGHDGH